MKILSTPHQCIGGGSSPLLLALLLAFTGALAAGKIDINTASLQELDEIIWVGPVTAQRIIDARPFYSVDELIKVKGIGEKRLADIKAQGLAWVDPNLQPAPALTEAEPEQRPTAQPETQREQEARTVPALPSPGLAEQAEKAAAAAVAEPIIRREYSSQQTKKPVSVFIIALALAVFSGVTVLILKNKLKKSYNSEV